MKRLRSLLFTILLLSPLYSDGQIQFIKDTDSISVEQYNFFVESTELYFNCVKETDEKDNEIFLLTELLQEKQNQAEIGEILINSQRNEIERLQRHRTILGVGVGVSLIAVILLAI